MSKLSLLQTYFNRVVVILTMVAGLAAAIAAPVANLDTSSVVALVGGLGAVVAASVKFLDGWQKHEARVADPYSGDDVLGAPIPSNVVAIDAQPNVVVPASVPVVDGPVA